MLTIRLQRVGRKNQPVFRIVLAEKHRAATKKIVESLGLYNPRNKEFTIKENRLKHWLEKRVPLSPTVHNLFVTKKLLDAKKVQAWKPKTNREAVKAAGGGAQPSPTIQSEVKTPEATTLSGKQEGEITPAAA